MLGLMPDPAAAGLVPDRIRGAPPSATPRSCRAASRATCTATPTRDCELRARQVAHALDAARAASSATASARWPGTATATSSCISASPARGRVVHTINPRLSPEQIAWIANHAEDQVLCFDLTFLPLVEALWPPLQDRASTGSRCATPTRCRQTRGIAGLRSYEAWIGDETDDYDWPVFDENSACAPVLHVAAPPATRRACSTATARRVLHAYAAALPDAMNCRRAT